jgi:outer membrane protein assembly factor BamB
LIVTRRTLALAVVGLALAVSAGVLAAVAAPAAPAAKAAEPAKALRTDWPQWRGPNRDALSACTGLLKEWPAGGPPLLWKIEGLGGGFSSASVTGGRIYTMGKREDNKCHVICYDLNTQQRLWSTPIGGTEKEGPRCTPTVVGNRVAAMSESSDLAVLDAESGKLLWSHNFRKEFNGRMQGDYHYCESPLIDGDRVVATPGASNDPMMAAFDLQTGKMLWHTAMPDFGPYGGEGAGYSSIVIGKAGGVNQYVQLTGRGLVGVRAGDGKFLWGYGRVANGHTSIPTPVVHGDYVFAVNGYGAGTAMVKLKARDDGTGCFDAQEVYFLNNNISENLCGGAVVVGDYAYHGANHYSGVPMCIELLTGKVMWKADKQPGGGEAGVIYADGNLIFRNANGVVALVEATPKGYHLISTFTPEAKEGHSHPTLADGKLFLRSGGILCCYDLAKR